MQPSPSSPTTGPVFPNFLCRIAVSSLPSDAAILSDRAARRQARAPSFLRKVLQIFACFLQIFANISLVVLIVFNGLVGKKLYFDDRGFSKFLRPSSRRSPLSQNGILLSRETKTKRKRNEVVSPAKSWVLLSR
jgi:hypothetical protein